MDPKIDAALEAVNCMRPDRELSLFHGGQQARFFWAQPSFRVLTFFFWMSRRTNLDKAGIGAPDKNFG